MQAPDNHPSDPVIVPFPAHLMEPPIVMEFEDGPRELSQETSTFVRTIARETGEDERTVIDRLILHISRSLRREHLDANLSEIARLTVEKFTDLCRKQP